MSVQVETKRIKKNAARCLNCGDVIESIHVHDYVTCSCGTIAVDGGREYLKRVGNFQYLEDKSEYY